MLKRNQQQLMTMAISKFTEFFFMGTKNPKRSLCQAGEWVVHILRDVCWAAPWWAGLGWTRCWPSHSVPCHPFSALPLWFRRRSSVKPPALEHFLGAGTQFTSQTALRALLCEQDRLPVVKRTIYPESTILSFTFMKLCCRFNCIKNVPRLSHIHSA